jgi:SAM-dependent methyltransferase
VRVLTDPWSAGGAYEPYVGRWSRLVAEEFLAWLRLPSGARCLDVGSGTGALATAVHRAAPGAFVVGIDPSEAYVVHAQSQDKKGLYVVAGAQGLPFADRAFDAAVSGLVLNFVHDPARMLREMRRVVREEGTVAVYVWDYAGEMQMMRRFWDAAVSLDADAFDLDEGRRFPICNPPALVELFGNAGLRDVGWREIEVPTVFSDFDDYWQPFLGAQGPAPSYAMALAERDRDRLRDRLREALTTEPDGSIRLTARAWAVRGVR